MPLIPWLPEASPSCQPPTARSRGPRGICCWPVTTASPRWTLPSCCPSCLPRPGPRVEDELEVAPVGHRSLFGCGIQGPWSFRRFQLRTGGREREEGRRAARLSDPTGKRKGLCLPAITVCSSPRIHGVRLVFAQTLPLPKSRSPYLWFGLVWGTTPWF